METSKHILISRRVMIAAVLLSTLFVLLCPPFFATAEETRWSGAADAIDKYLDAAFEAYLAGDATSAYRSVNDAYFKIYEVTGFERQTLSYISGPRKNAVELQFSACKAAVKRGNADEETKIAVRAELNRLKTMIREDANKLARKDGEPLSEIKHFLQGQLTESDPWPEFAGTGETVKRYASWQQLIPDIKELLNTSFVAYKGYDFEAAADNLNTAFYALYEASGFSPKIYSDLSLKDRETADAAFRECKQIVQSGSEKYQWKAYQRTLKKLQRVLSENAERLDAKDEAEKQALLVAQAGDTVQESSEQGNRTFIFAGAFGIIVREGLEAILVIAAIIAYLVKSGNGKNLKHVYFGAMLGIVASFLAALVLSELKKAWAGVGQSQEIIEGITALIAVCVLFYVSNWMISKSEAAAWSAYIGGKVQRSVERRSAFTLAFTAFLSVFREGAEVVLFYQPMLSEGNPGTIWAGFGAGCLVLVGVYLIIRFLSIRLPVKLFFTATSILMAVMCVAFLGSGIKELAEGGLFDVTLKVPGIPESDVLQVLGIYPYLETLVPQLILAAVLLVTFMIAHYRGKIQGLQATLSSGNEQESK